MSRFCIIFALFAVACGAKSVVSVSTSTDIATNADADDATLDSGPATCVISSDCDKASLCLGGVCVAQTACKSDKACKDLGLVCEVAAGFCVQCHDGADCAKEESCKAHHCLAAPSPCAASKDCLAGQVCDKGNKICVECVGANDCGEGQACSETVCVPAGCVAGPNSCADVKTIKQCKSDRSGYETVACGDNTVCEDGFCTKQVCVSAAKSCDGNAVVTCNARGTGTGAKVPCAVAEICLAGACQPAACKAGAKKCENKQVLTCKDDGTSYDVTPCADKQTCDGDKCVAQVCLPNADLCDDTKQVKCNANGTATTLVFDSAAKSSEKSTCLNGACVALACTPASTSCASASAVATCKGDGSGFTTANCAPEMGCLNGKCKPKVCVPGESACDGTQISVCNNSGTALKPTTDCADGNLKCVAGKCANTICAAGQKQCSGAQLQTCAADGLSWKAAPCDDGDGCTTDSCDVKTTSCTATPKNCDDGDVCTEGDACKNGNCFVGKAKDCDDKNACTVDSCDKVKGCKNVAAAPDADKDGFTSKACGGTDCDDANAKVNPGVKEDCATVGVDDNCDGKADEGCVPPVQGAFSCAKDGDPCGGIGKCVKGHCFQTDAKGYTWTLVPAGTFWMGCNAALDKDCEDHEKPQHLVGMSAYWIGVYEVTVLQYQACVKGDGNCSPPAPQSQPYDNWGKLGKEQHPVNSVTWWQSQAYCKSLGGDLPSEAQWEKAARGGCELYPGKDCASSVPKYPWGNEAPICGKHAVFASETAGCGTESTYAVGTGSAQGTSPYGAYDMVGNVYEWIIDWYDSAFYGKPAATQQDPLNSAKMPATPYRVWRSSSFSGNFGTIRAGARADQEPDKVVYDVGIRCAKPFQ